MQYTEQDWYPLHADLVKAYGLCSHRGDWLIEELAIVGLHNFTCAISIVCDRISEGNELFG